MIYIHNLFPTGEHNRNSLLEFKVLKPLSRKTQIRKIPSQFQSPTIPTAPETYKQTNKGIFPRAKLKYSKPHIEKSPRRTWPFFLNFFFPSILRICRINYSANLQNITIIPGDWAFALQKRSRLEDEIQSITSSFDYHQQQQKPTSNSSSNF